MNIGPEDNFITINELFKKISNQLKFNQEPVYYKDRPNEVKIAHCSAEKAKKLLNYKEKIDLDTSIKKLINYIKEKGIKKFVYNYEIEINNENTPETWSEKKF